MNLNGRKNRQNFHIKFSEKWTKFEIQTVPIKSAILRGRILCALQKRAVVWRFYGLLLGIKIFDDSLFVQPRFWIWADGKWKAGVGGEKSQLKAVLRLKNIRDHDNCCIKWYIWRNFRPACCTHIFPTSYFYGLFHRFFRIFLGIFSRSLNL